ncbi:DUF6292 family protein [Amycolatopsis sp. CA-230715]|uniref:DUF6292 family protein n=1 Tax=Amycolatopsis sp. CA-230715 TaxID=2745196 RepID=UPI001C026821|nr:DUF6292 family protein [Amycolatopsis sp. CA-230715]QWF82632.1 hypothetical protein HUW46_06071 [Amycolatopsis sp. CA-230715]
MPSVLDTHLDQELALTRGLRGYVSEVATAIGSGGEACTFDFDAPVSAYVALDWRLPAHPGRDVALLWDEAHGWSAAIETHSGEDLIVIAYRGGRPVADPRAVVRFVADVRAGLGSPVPPEPARLTRDELTALLAPYRRPDAR